MQLQLSEVAASDGDEFEWQSPVRALSRFLAVVGTGDPSLKARSLLSEFGSLSDLLAAPSWRLRWLAGKRVASFISASQNLMKARSLEDLKQGPLVCRSPQLLDLLQLEIGFLQHERLIALYVDGHSRLMKIERIGDGALGEVPINARKIIGCGLAVGAAGLVLVHNHPSGIPKPSQSDLSATSRLRELGKEVGLNLIDHLIVARGTFGSVEDVWREARWAIETN
jgi:DNA repair protein RadC